MEEAEQQEAATFSFTEEGSKALADLATEGASFTLILCTGITSQTFVKINYGDAWKSVAVG